MIDDCEVIQLMIDDQQNNLINISWSNCLLSNYSLLSAPQLVHERRVIWILNNNPLSLPSKFSFQLSILNTFNIENFRVIFRVKQNIAFHTEQILSVRGKRVGETQRRNNKIERKTKTERERELKKSEREREMEREMEGEAWRERERERGGKEGEREREKEKIYIDHYLQNSLKYLPICFLYFNFVQRIYI